MLLCRYRFITQKAVHSDVLKNSTTICMAEIYSTKTMILKLNIFWSLLKRKNV